MGVCTFQLVALIGMSSAAFYSGYPIPLVQHALSPCLLGGTTKQMFKMAYTQRGYNLTA